MNNKAYLVLQNGRIFEGTGFGATGIVIGEAVFTTGMTGYIETLTDPSYYGQIITQTFPLIGNYGMIPADFENDKSHARGYIVRSWCESPSNFRNKGTIDSFLKQQNVIGICNIDTRALTKTLRETGVMNAMIISGNNEQATEAIDALHNDEKKSLLLQQITSYKINNAVAHVTCSAVKTHDATKNNLHKKVVLWDFGAKENICRELQKRGITIITMPAGASAEDILAQKPDGILLSNGPGDPQENTAIITELQKLCTSGIPIFGICLGHQLLALAAGGVTTKLKYGHRGTNQPVKQLETGRVYITSQNHGYAVQTTPLPNGAKLSFVNTNDNTCEGITYTTFPAFSVQFHPEASAGPLDTSFLFDNFIQLITESQNKGGVQSCR